MRKHKCHTKELRRFVNGEHKIRTAAYSSVALLIFLGVVALFPAMSCPVGAAEPAPQADNSTPSLTVSLQQAIDFSITPTSAGEFGAGVAKIYVSTSNSRGYSISIATNNGKNTLENINNNGVVQPVDGSVTPTNFANNTWGYAFGQGEINASTATYKALPVNMTEIANSASASANDQYTLTLGAKVNTAIPSGQYSNGINVSVIAEPIPEPDPTWDGIATMQEMTMEICEQATTDASKTLVDARGDTPYKSYEVFKAKDGNCWMRDNLAVSGTVPKANVAGGTDGTYTLVQGANYWDGSTLGSKYKLGYGCYYNFDAATTETGATSGNTNATASICPTGGENNANWVLPKTGESGNKYEGAGSFAALLNAHGGQTIAMVTGSELGFQYGGNVSSNTLYNAGYGGYYWSRTTYDSLYAYFFYFYSNGNVNPTYSSNRNYGQSIRCLYPSTSTKADVQAQ